MRVPLTFENLTGPPTRKPALLFFIFISSTHTARNQHRCVRPVFSNHGFQHLGGFIAPAPHIERARRRGRAESFCPTHAAVFPDGPSLSWSRICSARLAHSGQIRDKGELAPQIGSAPGLTSHLFFLFSAEAWRSSTQPSSWHRNLILAAPAPFARSLKRALQGGGFSG